MRTQEAGFSGFPPEGLRFLKSLKRNNRREWFQPRKEIFEAQVKAPMMALVNAINADLAKVAPRYVTDAKKAIFRIYRDTRFSHDKTPYKTHIAAAFGRRGAPGHRGGMFYFHVSPSEIEIAGGIYHPEPEELRQLRAHLAENHAELRSILAEKRLRRMLGEMRGEETLRVPKGYSADHPAADLLRKKDLILEAVLAPEQALGPGLLKEITTRFRLMTPLIEFLNKGLAANPAKADPRKFFDL